MSIGGVKQGFSFGLLSQKQGVETTGSIAAKKTETTGAIASNPAPLFNFSSSNKSVETTGSVASSGSTGSAGSSFSMAA